MVERRVYRNDPIEEALCELQFEPSIEWDLTFPGRFYEQIRDVYSGKPRQQGVVEAGFQIGAEANNPSFQLKGNFGKVLFPTEDERRLVGIGPNVLSTHILRPYPSWDDFYPMIESAIEAYKAIAEPVGVRHISIRYINQVTIEATPVDSSDYFTTAPQTPPGVPLTTTGFLSRIESVYENSSVHLTTTLGSLEAPERHSAFLLDLEVTRRWTEEPLAVEEAMVQVNELREREREAFEKSITERAREVFDAE